MSNRKQIYHLTEDVLGRLVGQGTYRNALESFDRYQKIKAEGGSPICFYSEFNGFSVLDENNQEQMRISISMGQRARPFPI